MSEQPWRPRTRDVLALLGFSLFWLLPIAYVGYRGSAPERWPITVRDLYSVSCLFGGASERISVFYLQVRREGQSGWQDVDESEYFRLEPFGHRNRFDRFMARFGYPSEAEAPRRELAQWLARADRERNADQPPIVAVRFLWGDHHIDPERPPQGCWRKPARTEVGPVRQLGKIQFIEASEEREP